VKQKYARLSVINDCLFVCEIYGLTDSAHCTPSYMQNIKRVVLNIKYFPSFAQRNGIIVGGDPLQWIARLEHAGSYAWNRIQCKSSLMV